MWSALTAMFFLSQLILKSTNASLVEKKKPWSSPMLQNKDYYDIKTCSVLSDEETVVIEHKDQKIARSQKQRRRQPLKVLKNFKKRTSSAFRRLCCFCC